MNDKLHGSLSAIGIAALLCVGLARIATADGNRTPPFPDTDQLGTQSWQLLVSIPGPQNPFLDETGASCGIGQRGNIWFLFGTFGNPIGEPIERECTIPVGKTIFMPVFGWFCIPYPGETFEQNIEICKEAADLTEIRHLRINGVARDDLIKRRANSRPFALPLPDDNVFGLRTTIAFAVHEGYFAILPPLALGHHTIRVQGGSTAIGLTSDVRYRLHIVKPVSEVPPPPGLSAGYGH